MKDKILIGQYVPIESVVHRLDPRAKLVFIFGFILIIFLADNATSYAVVGVFSLLAALSSKVPFSFLLNGMKPVFFLVIFTFLLHIFLTREGDVLWRLGPLSIYEEGVRQGIFISFRFFFLILVTTLLTLTTTPIEITDGLEKLLGPLKKIRFPAHELALMLSISLRFIPTLLEETEKIMKAQMARGVEFTSGPIRERVKAIVPLLVPLFVSSFKRAEELATAMEARGYRGGEGRSKYRALHWSFRDTALIFLFGALTFVLLMTRTGG
ncbi:energy-coupling factor transporter transmembrane component T family protein [Bacillus fonticola]|uniref:energy-coupling factor transporter transmembrane component T family protein n=1 Tax=Bacillus fonticola TaxID=2728853 RepID=UPI001473A464|nr:energy-coupling factor transporter transmembrane protein EcfT [Bacillus fonticola]